MLNETPWDLVDVGPSASRLDGVEQSIRRRALEYFESEEFDPIFREIDRHWSPRPTWRLFAAFFSFATTIGIPFGIYQLVRFLQHTFGRSGRRARLLRAARRSIPIVACPIIVNTQLSRVPGTIAPGLLAATLDPRLRRDNGFLVGVMMRIGAADGDDPKTEQDVAVARLLRDMAYEPHRRRPLPVALTDGQPAYAYDAVLIKDFLLNSLFDTPFVPCLVEPGRKGQILMLPHWVVLDAFGVVEAS